MRIFLPELLRQLLWLGCALGAMQAMAQGAAPAVAAAGTAAMTPTSEPPVLRRTRPRVCLVLSGGGARGAAHIGVLKALEQLHVPVDCIAGTSMGAIVGASYASGMSVDAMMKAIPHLTLERLFTDKPPRADESMRIKADSYRPLAAPEFGITDGELATPKGVISGVALEGELRQLVNVRSVSSFDRLPIPFRAVATSLTDGSMVVFDRGDLPTAMRASMSVPAMIAPLNFENHLLVDGGLVRNLPVDVARAMGADVIIAVNLGTPLLKPDQIKGLAGVAMQTLGILTEQNVRESIGELHADDVLLQPALGNFSAADFDHMTQTIPIGEAAVAAAAAQLRALAVPASEYAALRARQSGGPASAVAVRIDAIEIKGTRRVNPEVVRQSMRTKAGDDYDPQRVDLDMRRIYGGGDFESVRPDLETIDGKNTLVVHVSEKSWGPHYLRFGLALSSDLGENSSFNLYASSRTPWMNQFGGEWRNDVVLGNDVVLASSFYQPLSARQYFFVEPRASYSNTPLDIYDGNVLLSVYREQGVVAGADLGANFSDYGEARLGLYRGWRKFTLSTGPTVLPASGTVNTGLVRASLRIDRLDSVNFTRSGYLLALNAQVSRAALGATDSYNRFEGEGRVAYSLGDHTVQFALRAGGSTDASSLPLYALFQLGGFLEMSGYRQQQLLGPRYVYARALYQTRLARVPLFEGVYGGLALEVADMPQILVGNDQPLFRSATGFLAADTPLGAAYFGLGYGSPGGATAVYLFLGRPF